MWQVVLEPWYGMVGGSVTEALIEEWPSDDAIMALWVEHIVGEIQV